MHLPIFIASYLKNYRKSGVETCVTTFYGSKHHNPSDIALEQS
jgi:hypothetical protein